MYLISDGGLSCNLSNTKEAIMLTKNIKYIDGIKLDVYETLDNVFVLSISDELSKYAFSNKKISECTYKYLRKIKFFSHIFKYYIPTLEEILKEYDYKKIIVLKLNIKSIDKLFLLLKKYPYQYYFYITDIKIISQLIKYNYSKLATLVYRNLIIDQDNYKLIAKNDILLISKYPEKIYDNS